jgi:adenine-specific DNA-methyltransferase
MAELIWDGKYDKDGRRVAPVRVALPFQTIETVNESAEDRKRTLSLFSEGKQRDWRNRLIWGDNKYVLPSLLPEFAGKVNLIYIDPPFATGQDFSFTAAIPDHPDTDEDEETQFTKEPSIIEQKAYRDTWGSGLDSYLHMMYERLSLMRDLLADNGSIFVHCDWRVNSALRLVLGEVFGATRFLNEIIWQRTTNTGSSKGMANRLSNDTDSILHFSGSGGCTFNRQYRPYSDEYLARFKYEDARGKYRWQYMATYSDARLAELRASDMIRWPEGSRNPEYKQYVHELRGIPLSNLWADIFHINPMAGENLGYSTQKPEALLERIIRMSSNEGDLVADLFCGSGTTLAVAERLGRRWIGCDLSRFAVHVTRKRLLSIPGVKPFQVQNLGKYERQEWQAAQFSSPQEQGSRELAYRRFVLDLYRATPVTGHTWLHGTKAGRMVHVGAVDAPVTIGDVKAIAAEFWRAAGSAGGPQTNGVDVLGWEFAFEINELAKQVAAEANVDLTFKKIPREVLDKRAVEQGDVRFFELAALGVHLEKKGKAVTLRLADFVIPPDDVPEDVRRAIKHFSQMIDYWAVDWDFRDDTFHNQWQAYRTKKNPNKLPLETSHQYESRGTYVVVAKVIDILGNDTTKALTVKVA